MMALIHCDFFSEVLGLSTSMYVILPQPAKKEMGSKIRTTQYPTLYLLHGLSDDHTFWLRRTSIERYVEPLGLAVVMPAVHRSYYANMSAGGRYWTFVSEELPEIAQNLFGLSALREENFVAGNSMGGYGAFKMALGKPGQFCAAASLSGALDLFTAFQSTEDKDRTEWRNIFGDMNKIADSSNDLLFLAKNLLDTKKLQPKLYQWCGTEDYLYKGNLKFVKSAKELGLDLTYEESPGDHEWEYWDQKIKRVLEWLPLERNQL
jgi:putative tributyrin esterase